MSAAGVMENAYYQTAKSGLSGAMARIREMEGDFHPSMMKEYEEVKKMLLQYAVDLVKLGVDSAIENDIVTIRVEDETYQINKDEVKEFVGENRFGDLFPEPEEPETDSTDEESVKEEKSGDDISDDKTEEDRSDEPAPTNDRYIQSPYNEQVFNNQGSPIAVLLSYVAGALSNPAFQQIPENKQAKPQSHFKVKDSSSDLMKDVNSIQGKIIALEQEKADAKDRADKLKAQCDELNAKYDDLTMQYDTEREQMGAQIEALNQERNELDGQLAEMCETAEQNLRSVTEEKELLSEKIESLKTELKDKETVITDMESSVKELEDKLSSIRGEEEDKRKKLEDELENTKNALSAAEESLAITKSEHDNLSKELAKLQEEFASAPKSDNHGRSDRDKKIAEKRIAELEEQLNVQKDKNAKNAKKAEESEKHISNLKKEKESLKSDLETAKKEKAELEDEIQKLKEGDAEKDAFYKGMEQEMATLRTLAYEDAMAGCLNNNAFNRDFSTIEKDATILAMVGISGMKMINLNYGRRAGDNQIQAVASELGATYGINNVYRIMGDQFAIIIVENNYELVQNKLQEIKDNLSKNQINISFGLAIGRNCKDLLTMIKIAEEGSTMMKSGAGNGFAMSTVKMEPQVNPDEEDEEDKPKEFSPDDPEEVDMDEMLMQYVNG